MKSFFFYFITFFGLFIFEIWNQHLLGPYQLHVNLLLLGILYFGITKGSLVAELIGFGWGLLLDASALHVFGLNALLFSLIGYGAGHFRRQIDETKLWTQTLITGVISIGYVVFAMLIERICLDHPSRQIPWFQPFLNTLISPVVFWLMIQWAMWWNERGDAS